MMLNEVLAKEINYPFFYSVSVLKVQVVGIGWKYTSEAADFRHIAGMQLLPRAQGNSSGKTLALSSRPHMSLLLLLLFSLFPPSPSKPRWTDR